MALYDARPEAVDEVGEEVAVRFLTAAGIFYGEYAYYAADYDEYAEAEEAGGVVGGLSVVARDEAEYACDYHESEHGQYGEQTLGLSPVGGHCDVGYPCVKAESLLVEPMKVIMQSMTMTVVTVAERAAAEEGSAPMSLPRFSLEINANAMTVMPHAT